MGKSYGSSNLRLGYVGRGGVGLLLKSPLGFFGRNLMWVEGWVLGLEEEGAGRLVSQRGQNFFAVCGGISAVEGEGRMSSSNIAVREDRS